MNNTATALNHNEIERRLAQLPLWRVENQTLYREFTFDTFAEAFGFMTSVAICAQEIDHHPNWSNVYTVVKISLSTHEATGITERDFKLAAMIDSLL